MVTGPRQPRPPIGARFPHLWAGMGAIATVGLVIVGVAGLIMQGERQGPITGPSMPPTQSVRGTSGAGQAAPPSISPSSPSSSPSSGSSLANKQVILGRDLLPISTESCRVPPIASGAAWQVGPLRVGGKPFDTAYYCNLFSGGSGSLDFILGKNFSIFTLTAGFADNSLSTTAVLKLEIIGDGTTYLTQPLTIKFGDASDLHISVANVTRLELKVTETSPPDGGPTTLPALAAPTLTRSS